MTKQTATKISTFMLDAADRLNSSIDEILASESHEEFVAYRALAGRVMGEMYSLLRYVYRQYPDLEPPDWRGE